MSLANKRKKKKRLSSKQRQQSLKHGKGRESELDAMEALNDEIDLRNRKKSDLFVVDKGGRGGKRSVVETEPVQPQYVVHSQSERSKQRKLVGRILGGEANAGVPVHTPYQPTPSPWLESSSVSAPLHSSKKRARKDFQVPNSRKSVMLPGHGESYNPDSHYHQDMMGRAAAFKTALLRREHELKARRRVPQEVLDAPGLNDGSAHMKRYLDAVQSGAPLIDSSEDEDSEEEDSEEYEPAVPYKPIKRKTQKQRRSHRRNGNMMSKKEQRKRAREQLTSNLALFDDFDGHLESQERKANDPSHQSRAERVADDSRVKRVGKRKYRERMPDVLLPSELPDSLRNIDGLAVTNPFEYHYLKMQARNLVPVTVHHSKQKKKTKRKVKRRRETQIEKQLERKGLTPKLYLGK